MLFTTNTITETEKLKNKLRLLRLIFREKKYLCMTQKELKKEISTMYKKVMSEDMDIDRPQNFTQKIQWMKIYDVTPQKTCLSDKYLVREWVKRKIGEKYLIPLIGIWNDFDEIDFNKLPEKFCLKANHGSAMNYIVKDKNKLPKNLKKLISLWLKTPFQAKSMEFQYRGISKKIIAEKYIEQTDGNLFDYKIHCFHGKPIFIQCIGDRDLIAHTGYQNNYNLNWEKLNWIFEDYPLFSRIIPKPQKLEEMLVIAETLSSEFTYVRVDLYEVNGNVFFGEMTFTPASGFYPYKGTWTQKQNIELGNLI